MEAPLIEDMGFLIVKKIKLLGIVIDADADQLNDNFQKTSDNIRKLIAHWSKFNLSLIGRISISKTYLISQLTYIQVLF